MQLAFIKNYDVEDGQEITIQLCKESVGNRPVQAVYIFAGDLTSVAVTGFYGENETDELTGINMATLSKNDFANDSPLMYVVEPFSSIKITCGAESDGTLLVKGVY